jgi:hypothetical protein
MTRRHTSKLALAGAIAVLAVGCGSDDEGRPIPADIRQQLENRLDEAERRLEEGSPGACNDITNDTEAAVNETLDQVPQDVDPDVRDALSAGFARLFELVSERCQELESEQPDTDTQTTEEPPQTDTDTTPTDTDTTPTDTTPTDTDTGTDTTPEQPTEPGNGNGNGQGGGNGQGNGNGVGGIQVPGGTGGGAAPGDG